MNLISVGQGRGVSHAAQSPDSNAHPGAGLLERLLACESPAPSVELAVLGTVSRGAMSMGTGLAPQPWLKLALPLGLAVLCLG